MLTPNLADMMETLESSVHVSYVVDRDWRLTYCNPAWDRFAIDNSAPELVRVFAVGCDLHNVIAEELLPFYSHAFQQAVNGTVWESSYECSSPQVFRKFRMRIHPLEPDGSYLVTNMLLIEQPHSSLTTPEPNCFVNPGGDIIMCCHCRCSRRVDQPEHWDFVPSHLERSVTNISHSLCRVCLEYFYPKPDDCHA